MTITQTRPVETAAKAGHSAMPDKLDRDRTATFPLSVGYRFRYDKATGEEHYTPLHLADLLNPTANKGHLHEAETLLQTLLQKTSTQ